MVGRKHTETVAALILVGFSVFAWSEVSEITGGAGIFPRLIIYVLTFFSLVYLVRSIMVARPTRQVVENLGIFAILLVASIVYINGVTYLGYVTSSLIFIPLATWAIGFRRPLYILVVTLVYIVSVYVLFEVIFGRPLPSELLLEQLRRLW